MEKILEQAKSRTEMADVLIVSSEETPVVFEANRLKNVLSKQSTSVTLRVVKNGRIGYAATTVLDDTDGLVDSAVETAQFGMPAKFKLPKSVFYPSVEVFDPAVESVSLDRMIELGEEMVSAIRKHTPEIVCEAEITKVIISVRIMNSYGGTASYQKSVFGLGVAGTVIQGTNMLFVGESRSSCKPISETRDIIDVVINQLELAKNNVSVPTRQMPVIFTPDGVAQAFMPSLMAAFNGKLVLEGASPIGDKLSQQVFDKKLSLWDDSTIPYQPQSRICDDEGVPSQRTPLIEQGVVSGFLYDLQTAGMAGKRSTGNGNKGRGGLVAPSPSSFIVGTGEMSFEKMTEGIKEGLIVEQMMGAEQGNVLGGDFSGNVLLGYKVENGKIVGRVKDTMVAGNIYQVLKDITLGKEAKWVGGMIYTPHIYCSSLSVSSK